MSSPAEALWNFMNQLGQSTAGHIGRRMDNAAGLTPPAPYQPPPFQPPAYQPPPYQPPVYAAPAVATAPTPVTTPAPTHQDTRDTVEGSYADQVADGVACLSCTRGHLNGLMAAVEKAQKAVETGRDEDARKHWAMAAAEIDAMVAIDWSPEKLKATPPEEVAVIEAVRECVTEIRSQIPTPIETARALGSAKENVRFAVSPTFTERDQAEIEARLQIIDHDGNSLERGALLDVDHGEATRANRALREARHLIDRAQTQGTLYDVGTHKAIVKELEKASAALTPLPTPEQVDAVGTLCQSCSDTFYEAYFPMMRDRGNSR